MVAGVRDKTKSNQAEFLRLLSEGKSIDQACDILEISRSAFEQWRHRFPDFKLEYDKMKTKLRQTRKESKSNRIDPGTFEEFMLKYFGRRLFWHQLQWVDVIEGREPRDLHPAQTYIPGRKARTGETISNRILINVPPAFAKTETLSVFYNIYLLIKDPETCIMIISATDSFAGDIVAHIQRILTDAQYEEFQRDFAPPGGFEKNSIQWTWNRFFLGDRSSDNKDPSVLSVGWKGQKYGRRSDIIWIDDGESNENVGQYEEHVKQIYSTLVSRLRFPRIQKVVIVGTRVAARDMYWKLTQPNPDTGYLDWTYFASPAVLEFTDEPENWVTLWPWTDMPDGEHEPNEDGLYPRFQGIDMYDIREELLNQDPNTWYRNYQQQQIADNSLFNLDVIRQCLDGRAPGLIPKAENLGRADGMQGLYVIGGIDPASGGYTAMVIYGVDTDTEERFVIDIINEASLRSTDKIKEFAKELTIKYGVREWRVEGNSFQEAGLVNDRDINDWMASRGVRWIKHLTGADKTKPQWGIQSLSPLFERKLIHLPREVGAVKKLVDQLVVWEPTQDKRIKTDIIMALWFCEIKARELLQGNNIPQFLNNPWFSQASINSRKVIDVSDVDGPIYTTPARLL